MEHHKQMVGPLSWAARMECLEAFVPLVTLLIGYRGWRGDIPNVLSGMHLEVESVGTYLPSRYLCYYLLLAYYKVLILS